jgi:hypothetical protein
MISLIAKTPGIVWAFARQCGASFILVQGLGLIAETGFTGEPGIGWSTSSAAPEECAQSPRRFARNDKKRGNGLCAGDARDTAYRLLSISCRSSLLSGVGHFQKSAILFTSILLRPAEDPRAADASKTDERDIKDGKFFVQQGKAGAKRRIEIIGELVIDPVMTRKTASPRLSNAAIYRRRLRRTRRKSTGNIRAARDQPGTHNRRHD